MRRGLSPIVAVVLLIGTAVVGSAAMYFFAGGIATAEPSTNAPTPITVVPLGGGELLIANLGSDDFTDTLYSSDPAISVNCPTILAGEQGLCNITGTTDASEFTIYGAGTTSVVIQSATMIDTGECPWESGCTYIWDNAQGTGEWEDGRNWGQEDAINYPQTSGATAIFNATSTDDCTTSVDLTIGSVYIYEGYTGTLTLGGSLTVTGADTLLVNDTNANFDTNGQTVTVTGNMSSRGTVTLKDGSVINGGGTGVWYAYGTIDWDAGGAGSAVRLKDIVFAMKMSQTLSGRGGVTIELDGATIRAEHPDGGGNALRTFTVEMGDTMKLVSDSYFDNNPLGGYAILTLGFASGGTMTYEGTPTANFMGSGLTTVYGYANWTFYNINISGHQGLGNGMRLSHEIVPTTFYVHNSFITQSGTAAFLQRLTLVMGKDGAAGSIVNDGLLYPRYTGSPTKILAADSDYPWTWESTGTVDWDYSADEVWLGDGDVQFDIDTGGGGVEISTTGDMEFDNITVTAGDNFTRTAGDVMADGKLVVEGVADFGSGGNHTFAGVKVESGAVFNATSGLTNITSRLGGYAFDHDGTLYHNNGVIQVSDGGGLDFNEATRPYDLVYADTDMGINYYFSPIYVTNDFNLTSGYLDTSGGGTIIYGDVYINGGKYRSNNNGVDIRGDMTVASGAIANVAANGYYLVDGAVTVAGTFIGNTAKNEHGSLTISPGGEYNATSGNTTVSGNWTNAGTFNHNSGLVEFDASSYVTSGGSAFDNVTVSTGITATTMDDTTAEYTYIETGATLVVGDGTTYTCTTITGPGTLTLAGTGITTC
ncbi:hypothetical protein ACFLQ2_05130 [archaeon]